VPHGTFSDPDVGDVLSLSVVNAQLPPWLTFDPSTNVFSGTPRNEHVGTATIEITATDRSGEKVAAQFELVVLNTNDAPTAEDSVGETDEDALLVLPLVVQDDEGVGSLTLRVAQTGNTPIGVVTFVVTEDGISLTYDPSEVTAYQELDLGQTATDTFVVAVDDGDGGITNANVTITIQGNNDFHNASMPLDVNKDGTVAPIDALLIINWINEKGTGVLPSLVGSPEFYLDVNNDGSVSPIDVIQIINDLNDRVSSEGEAAAQVGAFVSGRVLDPDRDDFQERSRSALPASAVDAVFQGWQLTIATKLLRDHNWIRKLHPANEELTLDAAIDKVAEELTEFRSQN
jgi:VCBS repeat-containing protein